MKKYNILLSYKDLHAIKHALEWTIETKRLHIKSEKELRDIYKVDISNERLEVVNRYEQDIEHETKLLERITEKIDYLKDEYKI